MSKELFGELMEKDFYDAFGLEYEKGNVIESLLYSSAIPVRLERLLWRRLYVNAFTDQEADNVIEYLQNNQLDPINAGKNYTQTDIKNKLKNEVNGFEKD